MDRHLDREQRRLANIRWRRRQGIQPRVLRTVEERFHTDHRGAGPDYAGDWDGVPNIAADRILRWIAIVAERAA